MAKVPSEDGALSWELADGIVDVLRGDGTALNEGDRTVAAGVAEEFFDAHLAVGG